MDKTNESINKDKISRLKRIIKDYDWVTENSFKELGLERAIEFRDRYVEEILEIIRELKE